MLSNYNGENLDIINVFIYILHFFQVPVWDQDKISISMRNKRLKSLIFILNTLCKDKEFKQQPKNIDTHITVYCTRLYILLGKGIFF